MSLMSAAGLSWRRVTEAARGEAGVGGSATRSKWRGLTLGDVQFGSSRNAFAEAGEKSALLTGVTKSGREAPMVDFVTTVAFQSTTAVPGDLCGREGADGGQVHRRVQEEPRGAVHADDRFVERQVVFGRLPGLRCERPGHGHTLDLVVSGACRDDVEVGRQLRRGVIVGTGGGRVGPPVYGATAGPGVGGGLPAGPLAASGPGVSRRTGASVPHPTKYRSATTGSRASALGRRPVDHALRSS